MEEPRVGHDCTCLSQQVRKTSQRRWHLGWALKDDQTLLHLGVGTVMYGILGPYMEA